MQVDLFNWYIGNQSDLVKQYNGKYIAINDNSVVGVYDSDLSAVLETEKKYPLGTFIVQKCTPGEESYTQHFYSPNVAFA
jgi:hypothetical protein